MEGTAYSLWHRARAFWRHGTRILTPMNGTDHTEHRDRARTSFVHGARDSTHRAQLAASFTSMCGMCINVCARPRTLHPAHPCSNVLNRWHWKHMRRQRPLASSTLRRCSPPGFHRAPAEGHSARKTLQPPAPPAFDKTHCGWHTAAPGGNRQLPVQAVAALPVPVTRLRARAPS